MVRVKSYRKLPGSQLGRLKGLHQVEEPKSIQNMDDSWTGYRYKDHDSFLAAASGMDDHNLPIKMVFQAEKGREPTLDFYRLLPRHGNPVILSFEGASREDFDALLEAVERFYGKKAGHTTDYSSEREGYQEYHWTLGRKAWPLG